MSAAEAVRRLELSRARDAQLVEAGSSARRASIEELFAAEYPGLARYCWSLVRQRELAEDIAQESFSLLLRRWGRVAEPRAYLYRIATNLVRRGWKREARERLRAEELAVAGDELPADMHAAMALRAALARLTRRHREVVLLYYYAGFSVPEVASTVGRPVGTIKRQLSEARALLASQLRDTE